jgi:hypothetical protein
VISDISASVVKRSLGDFGGAGRLQTADLKHERIQASREEVARSLEGNWSADVLSELQQAVDSYQFAHRQMAMRCAETHLAMLPTGVIQVADQPDLQPSAVGRKAAKKSPEQKRPAWNWQRLNESRGSHLD